MGPDRAPSPGPDEVVSVESGVAIRPVQAGLSHPTRLAVSDHPEATSIGGYWYYPAPPIAHPGPPGENIRDALLDELPAHERALA